MLSGLLEMVLFQDLTRLINYVIIYLYDKKFNEICNRNIVLLNTTLGFADLILYLIFEYKIRSVKP